VLLAVSLQAPALGSQRIEAERMQVAKATGHAVRDATARGGRALVIVGRGSARANVSVRTRSRMSVVVRASRCSGSPRLVVAVDGSRVLSSRVTRRRWAATPVGPVIRKGRRAITLRLANPHRSRRCRRALRVDRIVLEPDAPTSVVQPPGNPVTVGPLIWRPAPHTTWQWQLSTPVDQSVDAQMFDIDLFANSAGVVAALHASGRKVVCYLSAGSLEGGRPDAGEFPSSVLGNPLEGWPGERWLDVRRLDLLGPILERRLDLCKAKGFDGVEPDNVDAYANNTGFPLSADDQLKFNRFLARAAHARGLSIGLKNDFEQVAALEPEFDWAISEQCFQYGECELLQPFAKAGKAVFVVEYDLATDAFCQQARDAGFMAMRKRLELDAWREPCW
jgi:hypothetical protein